MQIVPSLLATTKEKYDSDVQKLISTSEFNDNWVHIDVMDNKFVQSLSIEPELIKKYELKNKIEVHLMVEDPLPWVKKFEGYPVLRFIAPIEVGKEKIKEFVYEMKQSNLKVGLSINPETSISEVEPFLDIIDLILIMTIHPGFQGQELIPDTLKKVSQIYQIRSQRDLNLEIEVDGGVNTETIASVREAGVDLAVIGSGLFKYDKLDSRLKVLEKAAHDHTTT